MTQKYKIINDPVYDGFLNVDDPFILKLINHPYVQRLRRIKQLGMADLVYPGAVHTRFSHSLGALNLMSRALEVLKSKGVAITDDECRGAKAAILLHDIGHGPGSHVLENMIVHVPHEVITELLMKMLNQRFDGELDTALAIFKDEYPKHFLHQLVSSQLDMDRLDYLSRDSYFTGVREGIVGTDRIIYMLNVKDDELVVDEKGIYSVEQFIISRRLMYWQVYMHKTVVAAEIMLRNYFNRAIAMGRSFSTSSKLDSFIRSNIPINERTMRDHSYLCSQFADLDDNDLYQCLKENHGDRVLWMLRDGLFGHNLFTIHFSDKPFPENKVEELRRYVNQNMREVFNIPSNAVISDWKDYMAEYFVGTGELHNRSYDYNDHEIKVLCKDGRCLPIGEVSDQLDHSFLEKTVTKYYIYHPKLPGGNAQILA